MRATAHSTTERVPASTAARDWPRFLLPPVRDLLFLLSLWAILIGPLSPRPLADADIGWHIRIGEQILASRSVPRVDPFSSTMQGQPWFAWEWLYDVLLGAAHRAMGLNGVVLLAALLMSTTFAILFRQLLRRGTGMPLALLLWLVALGGASIHMFARPHIASWLLTLLWFVALERWEQGSGPRWLPWFFPVSIVLWVNLHGGWGFGLVLFVVYIAAAFTESMRGEDAIARILCRQRAHAMSRMFALSVMATLLNPYGVRLHTHIYRYLTDSFLMNRIAEFRSPDFHGVGQRCYVLILVLVLIAFAVDRSRVRVSQWLVVPLVAYAGVYAARNLPFAGMLLVLIAGPKLWAGIVNLAERPAAWRVVRRTAAGMVGLGERAGDQEHALRGYVWPALGATAAIVLCLAGGTVGSHTVMHAEFDAKHLPAGAVEYLRQEASSEPIFGPDQWGGYLIYYLYPQRRVVIDDRHDLYGPARFREYDALIQGAPGWQQMLRKWQMRTIVVQADSTLAGLLRQLPNEWRVVYEDKVALVLEREE